MKKILIFLAFIVLLLVSSYLNPTVSFAKEANSINELEDELSSLDTEKKANDQAKTQTKNEIKITEKNLETNELMRFEQLSNGENAYIEYISGASSTTDLIMRTAIVEQ